MLETLDWYLDRFKDYKVVDVLRNPWAISKAHFRKGFPIGEIRYTIYDISAQLGWSPKSVDNSLRRLERKGKAIRNSDGWKLKDE